MEVRVQGVPLCRTGHSAVVANGRLLCLMGEGYSGLSSDVHELRLCQE